MPPSAETGSGKARRNASKARIVRPARRVRSAGAKKPSAETARSLGMNSAKKPKIARQVRFVQTASAGRPYALPANNFASLLTSAVRRTNASVPRTASAMTEMSAPRIHARTVYAPIRITASPAATEMPVRRMTLAREASAKERTSIVPAAGAVTPRTVNAFVRLGKLSVNNAGNARIPGNASAPMPRSATIRMCAQTTPARTECAFTPITRLLVMIIIRVRFQTAAWAEFVNRGIPFPAMTEKSVILPPDSANVPRARNSAKPQTSVW